MFDPMIQTSVKSCLIALQSSVAHKFDYAVTGTIPAHKALLLATRLDEKFGLRRDSDQKHYHRKKGRAVFVLHMFPVDDTTSIQFWLLRTDGTHPLLDTEQWKDVRKERLQWLWWYELVQLPVEVAHRKKMARRDGSEGIKPVTWTWRITRDDMDRLKRAIRVAVQFEDERLPRIIQSLKSAAGARGIRKDVKDLYAYIRTQCVARKRRCPEIPTTVSWIGNRSQTGRIPLSTLVGRVGKKGGWFPVRQSSQPSRVPIERGIQSTTEVCNENQQVLAATRPIDGEPVDEHQAPEIHLGQARCDG